MNARKLCHGQIGHSAQMNFDACRFVQFKDGSQSWKGLPTKLHNQLNGRQNSLTRVETISCGEYGEWFVRFEDGYWRAYGHCDKAQERLTSALDSGSDVIAMEFGNRGTFAIMQNPPINFSN